MVALKGLAIRLGISKIITFHCTIILSRYLRFATDAIAIESTRFDYLDVCTITVV